MSTKVENVIHSIMSALDSHGIPLTKVVLHKFFYFAQTQRLNLGLRFEPWKYGPYSFDLAKSLDELVFWDNISLEGNSFHLSEKPKCTGLTGDDEKLLNKSISEFKTLSNGDYSFNNMEIIGTILYCNASLIANGLVPTPEAITDEFVAWKGEKYPRDEILKHIEKMSETLRNTLSCSN